MFEQLPANMAVAPGDRTEAYWDFRPENGENYRDVEARLEEFAAVLTGPRWLLRMAALPAPCAC